MHFHNASHVTPMMALTLFPTSLSNVDPTIAARYDTIAVGPQRSASSEGIEITEWDSTMDLAGHIQRAPL
jgi:hypothetical protein